MTTDQIVAPTDAQLAFIKERARAAGFPMPAVHSKTEASLLIDEIRAGTYSPPEWDEAIPF